jgi:plasmid stability protein
MAELILRDVDDSVFEELQERARRHGRTPAEEANTILSESLRGRRAEAWTAVDAIYRRLEASGQTFSDSADLLREDRDR